MSTRRPSSLAPLAALALAALSASVAGCSERAQVVTYPQGRYQGKPDTPPWQGSAFKGDRATWERDVARRTVMQNEYERIR